MDKQEKQESQRFVLEQWFGVDYGQADEIMGICICKASADSRPRSQVKRCLSHSLYEERNGNYVLYSKFETSAEDEPSFALAERVQLSEVLFTAMDFFVFLLLRSIRFDLVSQKAIREINTRAIEDLATTMRPRFGLSIQEDAIVEDPSSYVIFQLLRQLRTGDPDDKEVATQGEKSSLWIEPDRIGPDEPDGRDAS